jgi:hypothetical protein
VPSSVSLLLASKPPWPSAGRQKSCESRDVNKKLILAGQNAFSNLRNTLAAWPLPKRAIASRLGAGKGGQNSGGAPARDVEEAPPSSIDRAWSACSKANGSVHITRVATIEGPTLPTVVGTVGSGPVARLPAPRLKYRSRDRKTQYCLIV